MLIAKIKTGVMALGACILMTSCASLSKSECVHADWRAIGYGDGVVGMLPERIITHAKACSKAGISPNKTLWEEGRQEGLKQYCTVDNAYHLGKQGKSLKLVCQVSNLHALQTANETGRQHYRLTAQKLDIQKTINKDKQEIDRLRGDYEKLRRGNNLGYSSEVSARAYMASIPDKIRDLEIAINKHEADIRRINQELERLR